jgi:hypothetical protein
VALVARGATGDHDSLGHLAAGLVDHLAAEARRAGRCLGVGGEQRAGARELLERRGEDLVDDGDLRGVDRPLAVDPERAGIA